MDIISSLSFCRVTCRLRGDAEEGRFESASVKVRLTWSGRCDVLNLRPHSPSVPTKPDLLSLTRQHTDDPPHSTQYAARRARPRPPCIDRPTTIHDHWTIRCGRYAPDGRPAQQITCDQVVQRSEDPSEPEHQRMLMISLHSCTGWEETSASFPLCLCPRRRALSGHTVQTQHTFSMHGSAEPSPVCRIILLRRFPLLHNPLLVHAISIDPRSRRTRS